MSRCSALVEKKVIIAEAQHYPELSSTLQGTMDGHRNNIGRFILTESASPELMKNVSETLAGRVTIIEPEPLKMNEFEKNCHALIAITLKNSNPQNRHSGESSPLGREAVDVIEPTLSRLRVTGMQLIGALSADTLFTPLPG